MPRPQRVQQPGPEQHPRIVAVEGRGRAFEMVLKAGLPLVEAVQAGFAAEGFQSGTLNIIAKTSEVVAGSREGFASEKNGTLALGPFAYVMPALSKDGKNAAFYSETFRPEGIARLESGAMTFGARDGAPFFHCHALWVEESGKRTGGHILPEETIIAETTTVRAFGMEGAVFEGNPDSETNFKLFGPVPAPLRGAKTDTRAFALRLRPNQCFHGALEEFARAHGFERATIHGGVGSTIGAALDDGTLIENFATEVFITAGEIVPDAAGTLRAHLDVGLVDFTGQIAQGRLTRGANPVLMTFELILTES